MRANGHPHAVQLRDGGRRLPAHRLDDARVAEQVALPERVGGVLLPGVLGIAGAEGGVDAARGEHRVRVEPGPPPDDHHLAAGVVGRDRRPQPGRAGADDEHRRRP